MINFVRSDHIKERNVKNNNMINIICNNKKVLKIKSQMKGIYMAKSISILGR
jgi:hypothetical protein